MEIINSTLIIIINYLNCEENYGSILAIVRLLYCAYSLVDYASPKQEERRAISLSLQSAETQTLCFWGDLLLASVI